MEEYIKITKENIGDEHLCCAIGDKKHKDGVDVKKNWIKERLDLGHVFYKYNARGKIFIEYEPLDIALVPVIGDNYMYINCLWVAGSFKGKGIAKNLLQYAINDAKTQNKSGLCVISSKKKKPFFSEMAFFNHFGFKEVDINGDYILLALSFDGTNPKFTEESKAFSIDSSNPTIYYTDSCPYILNCLKEIEEETSIRNMELVLNLIDTREKALKLPCVFNNFALFLNGKFETTTLLNQSSFKKLIDK